MRKQGKVDFKTLGYILLVLLGLYALMRFADAIANFFGFSLFSDALSYINYILLLIVWIALQTAIIYGYYRLIRWSLVGFDFIRNKVFNWNNLVKRYILTHGH